MPSKYKRKGIALVWSAVLMIVFVALLGLVIDAARIFITGHQLQNAVDAAALAGSRYVAWDNSPDKHIARDRAMLFAEENRVANRPISLEANPTNDPDGGIVIGRYIMQYDLDNNPDTISFIPTLQSPNAMKVVGRLDDNTNDRLNLLFGSLFGVSSSGMQKSAIAMIYNAAGAGLLTLAEDGRGLYVNSSQNLVVNVEGGSIYVNSFDPDTAALFQGRQLQVIGEELNVAGGYRSIGGDIDDSIYYHDLPSTINTGVPPLSDPHAHVPEPDYSHLPDLSPLDNQGRPQRITVPGDDPDFYLPPGYYSAGVRMTSSNQTLNLAPDGDDRIYIFGGDNSHNVALAATGGTLNSEGVMIHLVEGGGLDMGGNATINMTPYDNPSDPDDPYNGFSIFQARDNTAEATITGSSDSDLNGILYFPNNTIHSQGGGASLGTQLIAHRFEISGSGEIRINAVGNTPQIADTSFLCQ